MPECSAAASTHSANVVAALLEHVFKACLKLARDGKT